MNLGSQILVSKQSTMPTSSGASWNSAGAGDGNVPDQFPAGLRVLVVDDDPTCLMILEKMLKNCKYEVTKCNRAEVALSLLRENKSGFDVVISDVHMPDMDGFKLLVHIGLEMDLPVIMMSADDSKSVVMKGVTHGACDYLIKPVRMEALRNIWQHVVRKRKHEWKDYEPSASLEEGDRPPKQTEDPDYSSSANEGHNWKNAKRRKDDDDEAEERDESSSLKKPRVVWSVELHQQFVAAVNQLGIDKAVPKKILDLMNVPGLTRENVASHLQKYRLYLRRLSGSQQSGGLNASFMGNPDAGYSSISSLSDLDLQALAASGQLNQLPAQSLATLQAVALGRAGNSRSISLPVLDQRNIFSFENPKLRYGQGQGQGQGLGPGPGRYGNNSSIGKTNLLHGIPTTMEPKQLVGLQQSYASMNSQGLIPMTARTQTHNLVSRPPALPDTTAAVYNPVVSQASSLVDFPANHRASIMSTSIGNRGGLGVPSIVSTSSHGNVESKISRDGFVPSYGMTNDVNQTRPHNWGAGLTANVTQHSDSMQGGSNVHQHNYTSDQDVGGSKVIFPPVADEHVDYGNTRQPVFPEEYSQEDLLSVIHTQQQQQQGIGQQENEFGFDWYPLDNLPA